MDSPDEGSWIGTYILNKDGNPVPERDALTWAKWYETADRQVALTPFAWGWVSTIFLGLDHSFVFVFMSDPLIYEPELWETMVFGGSLNEEMRHYRSREEALEGHREMVERCREAQKDPEDRISMEVS